MSEINRFARQSGASGQSAACGRNGGQGRATEVAMSKLLVVGALGLVGRHANIGAALQHVKAAAEQFKDLDRWGCLLRYVSDRIAPVIGPPKPPPAMLATG